MNYSAILALLVTLSVVITAIVRGGSPIIFMDFSSVLFLVGGTALLTLASHGLAGWSAICGGLKRMLMPATTTDAGWGQARCQQVAQVARTAGNNAIMMAACGAMIGLIQILRNLDDPTYIGPAMAVCLLCAFYAVMLNLFLFIPLARHFREAEQTAV